MQQPSKRSAVLIGAAVFAAVAGLSWYLGTPDGDEAAAVVESQPRKPGRTDSAGLNELPPALALSQSPRMAPQEDDSGLFATRSWTPPP
ncbi:MAG TPA: hypothetical protein VN279_09540, partial [Rhodocyclaceae bacterium]|nr:hypothetical protein [Rhodocyclaceae bacterium]